MVGQSFSEDIWFGNAPLATRYWDIRFVSYQQTQIVASL
jgi:hypothetical protein